MCHFVRLTRSIQRTVFTYPLSCQPGTARTFINHALTHSSILFTRSRVNMRVQIRRMPPRDVCVCTDMHHTLYKRCVCARARY